MFLYDVISLCWYDVSRLILYQLLYMIVFTDQILAPGYKGRAKFMFFTEQCQLRKKSMHDFEQQLNPIIAG